MALSRSYPFFFSVFLLFFLPILITSNVDSAPTGSIALGSSFSGTQTLQSANGLFELGFLAVPPNSSSLYFGIWYAAPITPITEVWVANRKQAVSPSASFSLSSAGEFSVVDANKTVWTIGGLNVSAAVLMDTGNFVLQTPNSTVVWQSFDHPGDTWLPTMTLGPGMRLQAWVSPTDPSIAPYSLEMGASREEFVSVWRHGTNSSPVQYWTSGPWDGQKFSLVPEMTNNWIYNFTLNSSGFTWEIYPNVGVLFNISRFTIASNGLILQQSYNPTIRSWSEYWFQPKDSCKVFGVCGKNAVCNSNVQPNCKCVSVGFQAANAAEWATNPQVSIHGCVRSSPLNCSTAGAAGGFISNDGFLPLTGMTFDKLSFAQTLITNGESGCSQECLKNCSCKAFYYAQEGNCSLIVEDLFNGRVATGGEGTYFVRVAASDLPQGGGGGGGGGKGALEGAMAGVAMAILLLVAIAGLYWRKKKRRHSHAAGGAPVEGLRTFSYVELQAATKNFRDCLGRGAFGSVFRGDVDGLHVAIKRLDRLDPGEKQFRAEVKTIGTVQHINLVRLLGFCSEGPHRLLVYELAAHGSLDAVLSLNHSSSAASGEDSPRPPTPLDWPARHIVALGVARAIAYLHESCRECIIHCDIKPENILLDAHFIPKVADFGLAKLVGREFSHVLTTLRGTRGYLAPEWIAGLAITAKADVYSYGMTLLELITGRRNMDMGSDKPQNTFFPVWAAQVVNEPENDLSCLADPRLQGIIDMEQLRRIVYCAIWCIQDDEEERPSMNKVVQILEGSLQVSCPPIPTSLQCLLEGENQGSLPLPMFSL